MTTEADLMRRYQINAAAQGIILYRNNVGLYYTRNGTPVRCGLCVGSSDLIGYTPTLITPEHVGDTYAVFTAVEIKTGRGRASREQTAFIRSVLDAGGFARLERLG